MPHQTAPDSGSGNASTVNYSGAASTANMPFTFTHSAPNQTSDTSPQQTTGNVLPNSRRPIGTLVEEAVQRALDKSLKTLTAEVNRLKKVSDQLSSDHKQAPIRTLETVLCKVTFKLDQRDTPKLSTLKPSGILKRLGLLGNPYNQVMSARINTQINELTLFTESLPVHDELKKKESVATTTKALDLAASTSIKLETYWVILHEYKFTDEYLKNCKEHLEAMRSDTGLHISDVRYVQQRLLWSFTDPREAIKACQRPLFFSGDHALAMAYDQRATPIFCRRCGCPGHMSDNARCPKISAPRAESWPCIICAEKHSGEGATHLCPNRGNKELYCCLNCKEAGLDDTNHRTDFHKCPAPITVEWRAKWRAFATVLPDWAVSIDFPSTDHLRASVEQGMASKGPKTSCKGSTNANKPDQMEGSGAAPGTQTLNRRGLMRPKKDSQSSTEGQAIDSDKDDDDENSGTGTTAMEASDPTPSQSPTVERSARKVGHSSQQLGIMDWAKPINATAKSNSSTPSSSNKSTDVISQAPDDKSNKSRPMQKDRRGKATSGKKRTRSDSDSSPGNARSKPRVDSQDVNVTNSPPEQSSPSGRVTDTPEPVQNLEGNNDTADLSQYFDDCPAMSENEDLYE